MKLPLIRRNNNQYLKNKYKKQKTNKQLPSFQALALASRKLACDQHGNRLVAPTVYHPSVYESRVRHLHTLKINVKFPEEIFEPKANVLSSEPRWLEAGQLINTLRKLWLRHSTKPEIFKPYQAQVIGEFVQ